MDRQKSNWPLVLYAIAAINYVILVASPFWLGQKLGCTVSLPDLSPLFSPDDFTAFKDCLSTAGNNGIALFGKVHTFGADFTFPTLFALCLIMLTLSQARHLPRFLALTTFAKAAFVGFMPVCYALSDYVENRLVWLWLNSEPSMAQTASITVATTLKFTFLAIALAILVMFTLAKLKHRRSG